jgi:tetratricopeptide (TPR) repeat protein
MRTLINDAILEHQQNNLVLAKSLYEKILSIEPDHSDANHNLGVLLASLGQTLEASEHFARALESNQAITQFWKSYIDNLRSLSDLEKLKSLKSRFQISQLDAAEQVIINELFESAFSSAIEANFVQKSRDLYQSGNFQECVGLTEEYALMGLLNAEIPARNR